MDPAVTPAGSDASEPVRELLERASKEDLHDPDAARELTLEARVLARAIGDRAGEAEALLRLAGNAQSAGQPDDAFVLASEAAELANASGHRAVEAWALHLLGVVHYQASNFPDAIDHCQRGLEIYESAVGGVEAGNMLNTIAAIYHSMGDTDRAIATYEDALAATEPFGRLDLVALVLGNIARVRAARSEYLAAVSTGQRAVNLAREHHPAILTSLLADLGEAFMGIADTAAAAKCFAEARLILAQQSELGEEPGPVAHLAVIVAEERVALRRGALDEAIALLQTALELAQRAGAREYELEVNELLATAFKRCGRFEEALEARERHGDVHRVMAANAAELRLRTLRFAHETAVARLTAELVRARSGTDRAEPSAGLVPDVFDADAVEAFDQLAALVERRDTPGSDHPSRVGDLAAEIAHALGEPPEWCEQLRMAARLHDVGKVAVPDWVLRKSGPLTVEEYELMKSHTSVGHRILAATSTPIFQMAAEIAQSHHEWWDGGGYPLGLRASSIALSGRIVGVVDVYDALCSERPYKRAWPEDEAARFIVSGRGVQFDPDVVDAFVRVLKARNPDLEI